MNLEAMALRRAEEQLEAESWRAEERSEKRTPPPVRYDPVRKCMKCRTQRLRHDNASNLCRFCAHSVTPRQREFYRRGVIPPKYQFRATPARIARSVAAARRKLKARGINVEAA